MTDGAQKVVLCSVGTRPEAIKMAPVIVALRRAGWADCRVVATAQHRGLLDQTLACFGIGADVDLDCMRPDQTLSALTARMLGKLDEVLAAQRPDLVLAQGDTTSVLATALASLYRRVPFGHIEAGLRTRDLASPFPEEANRALAARLAALHFAPTAQAQENLVGEGVPPDTIRIVGNPVIDALQTALARKVPVGIELDPAKRLLLVTMHRRESFGAPLGRICAAIRSIIEDDPGLEVLWPVHPNPSVAPTVFGELDRVDRVHLCSPLSYVRFVSAMNRAHLILTDSGGIQEEAPALGKPVLVARDQSERPEAVEAGAAELVGTDPDRITAAVRRLLDDADAYARMSSHRSLYGDGCAAGRIVEAIGRFLSVPEAAQESPSPDSSSGRPAGGKGFLAG